MNNRHPWQLKKSKSWGPFQSYQLNSTVNTAHLAHFQGKLADLAEIGSTVQLVALKRPPGSWFFQLSWVPIIQFSLFPLRPMPPNLLDLIKFSQAVCLGFLTLSLIVVGPIGVIWMSLLGLETGKIKQRITNFYTVTSIKFGYEDRVASNLKWKIFFFKFCGLLRISELYMQTRAMDTQCKFFFFKYPKYFCQLGKQTE